MSHSISNASHATVTDSKPIPDEATRRRTARRYLLAIFLVCAAPFVLGTLAYYFFPTSAHTNYGELLSPKPLTDIVLTTPGGERSSLAALQGKWLMVQFNEGRCDEACERKLYNMRQSRTAQGREMDRIERVWMVLDGAAPDAPPALYEGSYVAREVPQSFLAQFPTTGDIRQHVYLVDPLGNLMLRFPPNPEPKRIIKDLQRLLRVSRIG